MSYKNYMDEYNKIGYSSSGIKHIKNFANAADLNVLTSYLGMQSGFGTFHSGQIDDEQVRDLLANYQDAAYAEVIENYSVPNNIKIWPEARVPAHLAKWDMLVGQSMPVHSDSETPSRNPAIEGGFYRYNITAIAYLTDSYLGGEISFPEFDGLEIKPQAGDLLLFPSRYRHCIKTLVSGERYTMPMFFGFDVQDDIYIDDDLSDSGKNLSDILFFE